MEQFIRIQESAFNRLYYRKKLTHFTVKPELYVINKMYGVLIDEDNDFLFNRLAAVVKLVKITEHDGLNDMSCLFLELVDGDDQRDFLLSC